MANLDTAPRTARPAAPEPGLERAIVLQTLREDHGSRWSLGELTSELAEGEPAKVEHALEHLLRERVLERAERGVQASRPTRRLNELELIAI